jgi:hypothetical protein
MLPVRNSSRFIPLTCPRSDRSAAAAFPRREEGPGSPFGPEFVPPETGSASVVYWVPGPFPGPTPRPAGSAEQSPSPVRLARGRMNLLPHGTTG